LRKNGLLHCISVSNSKALLFDPSLESAIQEIIGDLQSKTVGVYSYGEGATSFEKYLPFF